MKVLYMGCLVLVSIQVLLSQNQTDTLSPVLIGKKLPFAVKIERTNMTLPNGIHSGAWARCRGKWLFIAGKTQGLHGFTSTTNNFPPQEQNRRVYVIDPIRKMVVSRSLNDPRSGLNQTEIDSLSVISPEFHQKGKMLYMVGGYGVNTATGQFSTKSFLTAINVPALMHWVTHPDSSETAHDAIRQMSDPLFQVTGGDLKPGNDNSMLLILGQNFKGFYFDGSNGIYTQQIRKFTIIDDGQTLDVANESYGPASPNLRRRDLNVVPIIRSIAGHKVASYLALAGVFTVNNGVWTVPVSISLDGKAAMANPNLPQTFKQGMNNYVSPTLGLFSSRTGDMYTIIFGGITYQFYQNGSLLTDPEIPFTNQCTAIKIDKNGTYSQYLLNAQYPPITSTQSNPGNTLLFGAGAFFINNEDVCMYDNEVIKLDAIKKTGQVIGHIVGGIQSTLPNTNVQSDSTASPYIFKVTIIPA